MKSQIPPLTAVRFAMLTVLAGLLVALAFGVPIPRWTVVALILAQAALRVWAARNNPALRNSSLFQMLVSVVIGYLILVS